VARGLQRRDLLVERGDALAGHLAGARAEKPMRPSHSTHPGARPLTRCMKCAVTACRTCAAAAIAKPTPTMPIATLPMFQSSAVWTLARVGD
jgi:hypothetical protein